MNTSDLAVEVGQRLKRLRMERGDTQAQLAASVGISTAMVGMLERGERLAGLDTLVRIAAALRVPVASFLEDPVTVDSVEMSRLLEPFRVVLQDVGLKKYADAVKAAKVVWFAFAAQDAKMPDF